MSFPKAAPAHPVEIWLLPLDVSPDERDHAFALLSLAERARADKFAKSLDRDRWIVAHGHLRRILSEQIAESAHAIAFSTDPQGRPYLTESRFSPLDFNLSHSDAFGLLAISCGLRVGADIEAIKTVNADEEAFALAESECGTLQHLTGAERAAAFCRFWTLKEAFLKAVGTGLATPLQDFAASPESAALPQLLHWAGHEDELQTWHFETGAPAKGYRAAVAAQSHQRPRFRWHPVCKYPADTKLRRAIP